MSGHYSLRDHLGKGINLSFAYSSDGGTRWLNASVADS